MTTSPAACVPGLGRRNIPPLMAKTDPITILSDVHYGHPGSRVREAAELDPIFEQSRLVVFNGDTVEQREPQMRDLAARRLHELRIRAEKRGCEVLFITGNHDPAVSERHHLDLCGGALLVTHGDILFEAITPWASNSQQLKQEYTRLLNELDLDETEIFERQLSATKQASLMVGYRVPPLPANRLGQLLIVLREFWPPTRPLRIIRSWIESPRCAFSILEHYRPKARMIIFGHTHYPGVWTDGKTGRKAINTGSFIPPLGPLSVQLDDDTHTSGTRIVARWLKRHKYGWTFANSSRVIETVKPPTVSVAHLGLAQPPQSGYPS